MEINWFGEFVVLSETLHYAQAAEKLYMTQSTLSKHIQALEKELGAPLVARGYHKLELTPFGRVMLPYAYDMMSVRNKCEEAAFTMLHGGSRVLRISAIPALPDYNITEKFIRFQQKYPDVKISVSEADSIVIRKELLERQCDLAIMRDSRDILDASRVLSGEDMLRRIPFCRDELVAVLPTDHPLAREKQVSLQQLSKDRFVLIREGSLPYQLCLSACKAAGFIPQVEFTSHNRDAMVDMVVKGSLTALLFSSHVENLRGRGRDFAAVPIRPALYCDVFIACLKHENLPDYAQDFIAMFEERDSIPES